MKTTSELTPAAPAGEGDLTEAKDSTMLAEGFEHFKEKYEAHINMIAEKRRQEEEQKKREQELLEEQQRKAEMEAEESKAEEDKGSEAKEEPATEEVKAEGEESPELKEEGSPEGNEDPNNAEELPVAEPLPDPIELPKPECVLISKQLIFDAKLPQGHSIVLKPANNISATELILLPLDQDENGDAHYKDYISVRARQLPHRYFIRDTSADEEEPAVIEKDQVPRDLSSYFTDAYAPLKLEDWEAWLHIISKLNAVGYLLIPPMDTTWPYKVDACVMHVLPLPNDGMRGFDETRAPLDKTVMSVAEYEKKTAEDKGEFILFTLRTLAVTVAEYQFPHACHLLPPKASPAAVAQIYEKCAESIEPERENASSCSVLCRTWHLHGAHGEMDFLEQVYEAIPRLRRVSVVSPRAFLRRDNDAAQDWLQVAADCRHRPARTQPAEHPQVLLNLTPLPSPCVSQNVLSPHTLQWRFRSATSFSYTLLSQYNSMVGDGNVVAVQHPAQLVAKEENLAAFRAFDHPGLER